MSLERLFSEVRPQIAEILDRSLDGHELSMEEAEALLQVDGAELYALMRTADLVRQKEAGDDVSYVVCRNINFTNICYVGCSFCGFSRHRDEPDAYDHSPEVILEKCRDAVARGATEVCIQGGIHPAKDHSDYRAILATIKGEFPDLHIHAFSPEEIDHGHRKSGMELHDYLRWLQEAGLGTLPGTAAEILDDELRKLVNPNKIMTDRWVEIVTAAHRVGLRSSSTIMYGHMETPLQQARHLNVLRDIQKETGGFTEFVPLGFIHERNTLFNHMGARAGSDVFEDVRMVAVGRLFLRSWISNVQVSWVKMGPKLAALCLAAGANDLGGTLMEESISRESGSDHGENMPPEAMRRLIRTTGRTPVERSTRYEILRRFEDPAQDPPSLEPQTERKLSGPARWREQGRNPRSRSEATGERIAD